jgi:hypothetical protein
MAFVGAKIVLWAAAIVFGAAGWFGHDVAEHGAKVGPVEVAPVLK